MPLSDHEQRLLEQIEQALYDEDPKFARLYQTTDVRSHYRSRLIRAAIGVVLGLAILLAAVIVPLIPLGVVGFLVMLASASYGVASWQRMVGQRVGRPGDRPRLRRRSRRSAVRSADGRSLLERLEQRWQRRQDGNR
ncbi:MAG TPA: DUF3040 domain-containing protein [Mycobacteriales bacterium]|nr:DUF3040 domain-containing protein [Mycobacteriales bacterium]HWB66748.1 DUF3040 domain-containing protein [Mycobacteriales bacterium]